MTSRPRLLFLAQTLPFPPDGGVNIRTFNVLKLLSERYEIDAVCFFRRAIALDVEGSVSALAPYVRRLEVFPIEQEYSRARLLLDHSRSVFQGKVYTRFAYESPSVRSHLMQLLSTSKYDIAHVDSLDLSTYLPLLASIPVVCVHHNIESQLLSRRASLERSPVKRFYFSMQARRMAHEEALWAPRVALNITCSPDDAQALSAVAPSARSLVVPNGVDIERFVPGDVATEGIVSVGGTTWFPNKDALAYFSAEILPLVASLIPVPRVIWVGRADARERSRYDEFGVTLTGYVKDVRPYVQAGRCFIVPLRVGGGTRLKILDAWAMGKAIVSTSVGCEGLKAVDGENILIRDDPKDFATAIRDVLENEELRVRLERGARETAESVYSWRAIGPIMDEAYLGVLTASNSAVLQAP